MRWKRGLGSDFYANCYLHPHTHAHRDQHPNDHVYTDKDKHPDQHTCSNAVCYAHPLMHEYTCLNCHTSQNLDTDEYAYGYSNFFDTLIHSTAGEVRMYRDREMNKVPGRDVHETFCSFVKTSCKGVK